MTLKEIVRRYLRARDTIADMGDRGQDDSGERESPSFRAWCAADCEYNEALDSLREAAK